MLRTIDFIFVLMVLGAATTTYVVKYGSAIKHSGIGGLERDIAIEKEAIDILNANWSLLTSPARVQLLSKHYSEELHLEVLQPEQIITLEEIPMRKIEPRVNRNAFNGKR